MAFLVPEFVVVSAASQWWAVRKDKTSFQGVSCSAWATEAISLDLTPFVKGWTRRHSYFTIMGGFYKERERLESLSLLDTALYPELLGKEDPTRNPDENSPHPGAPLIEEASPSKYRILVTESEILDKSKSDPLGKLFTVLQTTWFVAQYLERWVVHQPRTQLEVMTLAYAALNILVYALWWDKPLNVQEVIDVHGRASASVGRMEGIGNAEDIFDDAIDSLAEGGQGDLFCTFVLFPVVGILFGGIHCFAWHFPFPTGREKVLWRVCAVYCTVSPFIFAATIAVNWADSDAIPPRIRSVFRSIGNCIAWLLDLHPVIEFAFGLGAVILAFSVIFYVICRIILVVLTFTSLRALPAGVFEVTSWTSFFPHFG